MRQVVLRSGAPVVIDVPSPGQRAGRVLVANVASVISSGTERATLETNAPLPTRAIRNPDLVRKTLQHAREHGVRETVELVRGAVSGDTEIGYSCAGLVIDTGGIARFSVGQAVACAGAGHANHATVVSVPGNLVAAVPEGVALRDAAFTTLGAIAMQGVRRAQPSLGERVVVVGLGLLGLLTTQILKAAGCQVVGVEPVAARRDVAEQLGLEHAVAPADAAGLVSNWAEGIGADIVIVTASTSDSSVLNDSIRLLRRKGRVVPVGDVGMEIDRAPLYEREADVLISTSYGPGRYDASYETGGIDYPLPYVRWTENRNMEEFLRLLSSGQVVVEPLVGAEIPLERAAEAYAAITGANPPLSALLSYPADAAAPTAELVRTGRANVTARTSGDVRIAIVGPGSFVRAVHVPNIKAHRRATVTFVAGGSGTTAGDVARSVGAAHTATDWRAALDRDDVDLLLVGTRHDSHAEIAAAALRAGKAVFVEKPLGITQEQIDDVRGAADVERLVIGFNRRFAPLSRQLADELTRVDGPTQVIYRVSAPLPVDHWLNDPAIGGGRVLGEACHMIDYAGWLCGTPERVFAAAAPTRAKSPETVSITITYADGSLATVHYSGIGPGSMPKERIEVLRGGRAWVLDDFRSLTSYGTNGADTESARRVDKGHAALLDAVIDACQGRGSFEPGIKAAYSATHVGLAALESVATGTSVDLSRS